MIRSSIHTHTHTYIYIYIYIYIYPIAFGLPATVPWVIGLPKSPKMGAGGLVRALGGRSGGSRGALGGLLGSPWELWGAPGALSGGPWAIPEEPLGALGPSWGRLGARVAPRDEKERKRDFEYRPFGVHFGVHLGPKSTKNRCKI